MGVLSISLPLVPHSMKGMGEEHTKENRPGEMTREGAGKGSGRIISGNAGVIRILVVTVTSTSPIQPVGCLPDGLLCTCPYPAFYHTLCIGAIHSCSIVHAPSCANTSMALRISSCVTPRAFR